jgi:phage baseplate assembly protein W
VSTNTSGYTGISFPFRLNQKGGIAMSTTSTYDKTHIEEGLTQLLGTALGERVMERIGNTASQYIFDPNDESLHTLIKYETVKLIQDYEPRITVNESATTVYGDDEFIYVEIHYTINKYVSSDTEFVSNIQVGGINNGNY